MESVVKHFKGKTTSEGHELIVKQKPDAITIGFKHAGEYEGEFNPHINVARIEHTGETYQVGWYYDDGEEPGDSSEYSREDELIAALDKAIKERSKEVGAAGE
jgi:hypothetical protein